MGEYFLSLLPSYGVLGVQVSLFILYCLPLSEEINSLVKNHGFLIYQFITNSITQSHTHISFQDRSFLALGSW